MSKLNELKDRFTKDFEETLKQKQQLETNVVQLNSKLEQLRGAIFALEVAGQPDAAPDSVPPVAEAVKSPVAEAEPTPTVQPAANTTN